MKCITKGRALRNIIASGVYSSHWVQKFKPLRGKMRDTNEVFAVSHPLKICKYRH